MANIFDKIKYQYITGSMVIKLIIINVGIFILLRLIALLFTLFGGDSYYYLRLVEIPASIPTFLYQPWTIITYMFVHYDFWHILFNMLWFYWFGIIFTQFFTQKQLFALYIYGGLGGAVLYILSYNIFPYFSQMVNGAYMIGASASVIAIVVATAMRAPNYKVGLIFFGEVALKWVAIITIGIDIFTMSSANAGGHIAHLGGILVGFLFAKMFVGGKDITAPFNKAVDRVVMLFHRRHSNPFKVKGRKKSNMPKYDAKSSAKDSMSESDMEIMDRILEKIKKSGYASLSQDEKKRLFDVSNKK